MALKVYWTDFAVKELKKNFDHYQEKAGRHIAENLTDEIYLAALKLENHPEMGQIEILLENRRQVFRYLVHNNYNIIYRVNNAKHRIEINDVFDTRQNPDKIKRTD